MRKIDMINDLNRVKITLVNEITVVGKSWAVDEAEDDDGNELGFDVLIFKADDLKNPLSLKEEDIKEFEEVK